MISVIKHLEFVKNKPGALAGIIKGFFVKLVLRRNILRTVDFAITGQCHYKCAFCSAWRLYKKGGPFLTVGQIKDIWKQCVKLGAIHINLTGGEPFMRDIDELCLIIQNLEPSKFLVSLVSSGFGLTKEKLRQLKDAGLDTLQLSLESMDPGKHDDIVGIKGSFEKILESIKYAKELKLNICLNVVYYRGNATEIRKMIEFCKKEDVFLVLNTASCEGKWSGDDARRLTKEDEEVFNEFMRIPLVRHDSSVNFSGKRECPGGKERIHITAYGDVLTCPLVQISYGNALSEPLKDIYKRMVNMPHLKEYSYMCKHAFNENYYQDFLVPIENEEKRPVPIHNHPFMKRGKINE